MLHPKVSVIVPCFNQGKYLDECLSSILSQTFTDWECIIVNDGSTDNTETIAIEWINRDVRFRYLFQENSGLCNTRNAGIEMANGYFILPLDADDCLSSNYIEECLKMTINSNAKIIYGKAVFFGEREGEFLLREASLKNLLEYNSIHCSGLYRKTDWKLNNGYDENMIYGFEDWEFWINILKRGGEAVFVDSCTLNYRIKLISMNTELLSDSQRKKHMRNYILKKHIELYNYSSIYKVIKERLSGFNPSFTYKELCVMFLNKTKSII